MMKDTSNEHSNKFDYVPYGVEIDLKEVEAEESTYTIIGVMCLWTEEIRIEATTDFSYEGFAKFLKEHFQEKIKIFSRNEKVLQMVRKSNYPYNKFPKSRKCSLQKYLEQICD